MPYLIIDLEMTGTEAGFHDIIQIGAVLADNEWNLVAEFESLVYPENDETFSSSSEKIHGFSLADLDEAPMAYDVLENMEDWISTSLRRRGGNLHDVVLCGQSVINDINFLKMKYDDLNLPWPFSRKLIDLLSLTFIFSRVFDANRLPKPKAFGLGAVAEYFNLKREGETHDALDDARLTYQCFREYMKLADRAELQLL